MASRQFTSTEGGVDFLHFPSLRDRCRRIRTNMHIYSYYKLKNACMFCRTRLVLGTTTSPLGTFLVPINLHQLNNLTALKISPEGLIKQQVISRSLTLTGEAFGCCQGAERCSDNNKKKLKPATWPVLAATDRRHERTRGTPNGIPRRSSYLPDRHVSTQETCQPSEPKGELDCTLILTMLRLLWCPTAL